MGAVTVRMKEFPFSPAFHDSVEVALPVMAARTGFTILVSPCLETSGSRDCAVDVLQSIQHFWDEVDT